MTPAQQSNLNLLALPRETNARFYSILLVCLFIAATAPSLIDTFGSRWLTEREWVDWSFQAWFVGVLNIVIVLGLTVLLYAIYPILLIKRRQLVPVDQYKPHRIQAMVAEAAKKMSLACPRVYWRSSPLTHNAQVFGAAAPYCLLLDTGLKKMFRSAPSQCRAIIFHELSHVANGDVRKSYFVRLLLAVSFFVILVPGLLLQVDAYTPPFLDSYLEYQQVGYGTAAFLIAYFKALFSVVAPFAIVLVVLILLYAQFLRSREVFADWRASIHAGIAPLAQILETHAKSPPGWKSRLANLFAVHPGASLRLRAVRNPYRLLRLKPFDALGPAIIVGLVGGLIGSVADVEGLRSVGEGFASAVHRVLDTAQSNRDPAPADLVTVSRGANAVSYLFLAAALVMVPMVLDFGTQVVNSSAVMHRDKSAWISWVFHPLLYVFGFLVASFAGFVVALYLIKPDSAIDVGGMAILLLPAVALSSFAAVVTGQGLSRLFVLSARRRRPTFLIMVINICLFFLLISWANTIMVAVINLTGIELGFFTRMMSIVGNYLWLGLFAYASITFVACLILISFVWIVGRLLDRWRGGMAYTEMPGEIPLWLRNLELAEEL